MVLKLRRRRPSRPAPICHLRLEGLECRLVPATISWNVDTNGFWDVPGNWDLGRVPAASDDVIINRLAERVTVTLRDHEISDPQNAESVAVTTGAVAIDECRRFGATCRWMATLCDRRRLRHRCA